MTLVARGYGASLSCGLGGRRVAGSSSPRKLLGRQSLRTSDAGVCLAEGSHHDLGQVAGFPPQPFHGLSRLPAALGHHRGAHVGLLPALPKSSCLPLCWEGRESSPGLEEQQIHLQRNGYGCPSCALGCTRAAGCLWGRGRLAAIGGETSSSTPAQITLTCHVHVSHNPLEIKAAKNWSKQDTFLL